MAWEHFEVRMKGWVTVITSKSVTELAVEWGGVTTGRQRVFSRFFVRIELANGEQVTAEDRDSPVQALRRLNEKLKRSDIFILAAGLDARWYQTGHTDRTCLGYIEGNDLVRAYDMFELPPAQPRDPVEEEALDAMIEQAVSQIGQSLTTTR
ncbi:MAG: hypothetical protein ACKOPE_03840 [Novosphingobium sp.]